MEQTTLEKAEAIIERERVTYLSKEDCEVFFDALDNPPEVNQVLKDALADYKLRVG